MKKEDIKWGDWERILFGTAPPEFLIEVFIRSVFLFLFLLLILRLMGKRMGGMLTMSELAVMLTLGAIICVPMQIPDRGILQGFFVLVCALAFQRWVPLLGFRSGVGERITQGKEVILVKDGLILYKTLLNSNISNQQLFAVLRNQGIYSLGEVERIYLEASGLFSVFRSKEPRLGLSLYPTVDETMDKGDALACCDCGKLKEKNDNENCTNCGGSTWGNAIK